MSVCVGMPITIGMRRVEGGVLGLFFHSLILFLPVTLPGDGRGSRFLIPRLLRGSVFGRNTKIQFAKTGDKLTTHPAEDIVD